MAVFLSNTIIYLPLHSTQLDVPSQNLHDMLNSNDDVLALSTFYHVEFAAKQIYSSDFYIPQDTVGTVRPIKIGILTKKTCTCISISQRR